jgi:hypothetical protein
MAKTSVSELTKMVSFVAKVQGVHDVFEVAFYTSLLAKTVLAKATETKYTLGAAIADCCGACALTTPVCSACVRAAAGEFGGAAARSACRAHIVPITCSRSGVHPLRPFSLRTRPGFNDGRVRPTLRLFTLLGLLDNYLKNGSKMSLSETASTVTWSVFAVFDALNYLGFATNFKAMTSERHFEYILVVCRAWLTGELIGLYDNLSSGKVNLSVLGTSLCNIILAVNWSQRSGGPLSDPVIGVIGFIASSLQLQRSYSAHAKAEEEAAANAPVKEA